MKIPWSDFSSKVDFYTVEDMGEETLTIERSGNGFKVTTKECLATIPAQMIVDLLADRILLTDTHKFKRLTQTELMSLPDEEIYNFMLGSRCVVLICRDDGKEAFAELKIAGKAYFVQYDIEDGVVHRVINETSYSIWLDGEFVTGNTRPKFLNGHW